MRHHKTGRKLGRVKKQRTALLRSLARSLIIHGKIRTTEAKAKELRPFIEKLITKSKNNSLPSMRVVATRLGGRQERVVRVLFSTIAPKYKDRAGGYTRITKLPPRRSDASKQALIELV